MEQTQLALGIRTCSRHDPRRFAISGALGFCSSDLQLIAISEDQNDDAMQDTFLHEIMHALTTAFDLKEKDEEESFVRRLAAGICTVWNDNPKAFKWWRELV